MAVKGAREVNYVSAGTMEFLVDRSKNFYFMEMNTRVQVEHPITEMITGVDIVKEQILSAAGHKLRYSQRDIVLKGHAIECRINAEDPETFLPSPGKITYYHVPGGLGVRVDSAVYDQYEIQRYYDSLIGKVIVHAETREEAIRRMSRAIDEYIIEGVLIKIYNPAKTVADCFKYRNKIGLDVAIEALRDVLNRRKCTADELWRYAKACRVANIMRPYMEAMI